MTQELNNYEANCVATVIEGSDSSSTIPSSSTTPPDISEDGEINSSSSVAPPAGYENIPRELWPDANGNPPQLTEKLLRKLRGKYFTVKHPRLTECDHRLDMINEPRYNCENCWFQFFNTHPQLVEVADQFYKTHGKNAMISMRGVKFVKMFGRYMATVIHLMKEEGRLSGNNSEGTNPGSIDSSTDRFENEGGAIREADDQGGEIKSRGISSGLHEQNV